MKSRLSDVQNALDREARRSKVRTVEGKRRIVLIVVLLVPLLAFAWYQMNRKYVRFKHRSAAYHADFATACEQIFGDYVCSTQRVVYVPTTDATVPQIVEDWHPSKIAVYTNEVWILVDGGHIDGLAIIWEPRWDGEKGYNPKVWNLVITTGEGPPEILYTGNHDDVGRANN